MVKEFPVLSDSVDRSALSHDLRSPLTVITARLQMIRRRSSRGDPLPPWLAAYLESIEAAAARLVAVAERFDTPPHGDSPPGSPRALPVVTATAQTAPR